MGTWSPSSIPSSTTLRSVNPTKSAALVSSMSAAMQLAATVTNWPDLVSLLNVVRGAQASLTIINEQNILATATDSSELAHATLAIFEASLNLKSLDWDNNLYKLHFQKAANIIYLIVYLISLVFTTAMFVKSRYHWFNITFFCGATLEFLGFLGRVLSFHDNSNMSLYIMQTVGLTIAPAFIMAGIYFLFAQLVVIHGRQYSMLKPMWYSYFFITTDVLSLFIQAAGGGISSASSSRHEDTRTGMNVMIVGIVVQTAAMTVFLFFWFDFLWRLFFKNNSQVPNPIKKSFANFFKMLFNSKSIQPYKHEMDEHYNSNFVGIRQRKLVPYFPVALTCAVVVVYIRCVYRVVELIQGYDGYLIRHEVYLMVLDALMISICMLIFIPFHPVFVFGTQNVIRLATIKKNIDEKVTDSEDVDVSNDEVNGNSINEDSGQVATKDEKKMSDSKAYEHGSRSYL